MESISPHANEETWALYEAQGGTIWKEIVKSQ